MSRARLEVTRAIDLGSACGSTSARAPDDRATMRRGLVLAIRRLFLAEARRACPRCRRDDRQRRLAGLARAGARRERRRPRRSWPAVVGTRLLGPRGADRLARRRPRDRLTRRSPRRPRRIARPPDQRLARPRCAAAAAAAVRWRAQRRVRRPRRIGPARSRRRVRAQHRVAAASARRRDPLTRGPAGSAGSGVLRSSRSDGSAAADDQRRLAHPAESAAATGPSSCGHSPSSSGGGTPGCHGPGPARARRQLDASRSAARMDQRPAAARRPRSTARIGGA